MKKSTKEALLARYEDELHYLDVMIDLNEHNEEAVKQLQKQYRKVAQLLTALSKTKADDEWSH